MFIRVVGKLLLGKKKIGQLDAVSMKAGCFIKVSLKSSNAVRRGRLLMLQDV